MAKFTGTSGPGGYLSWWCDDCFTVSEGSSRHF